MLAVQRLVVSLFFIDIMDSDSEANQIADQDSVTTQESQNVEDEAYHSEDPPVSAYASGKKTVVFDEDRNQINERSVNESEYTESLSSDSLEDLEEQRRLQEMRGADLVSLFTKHDFVTSSPIKEDDVYKDGSTIHDNPMNSPRRPDGPDYGLEVPTYQNDESRDSSPTRSHRDNGPPPLVDNIPDLAHHKVAPLKPVAMNKLLNVQQNKDNRQKEHYYPEDSTPSFQNEASVSVLENETELKHFIPPMHQKPAKRHRVKHHKPVESKTNVDSIINHFKTERDQALAERDEIQKELENLHSVLDTCWGKISKECSQDTHSSERTFIESVLESIRGGSTPPTTNLTNYIQKFSEKINSLDEQVQNDMKDELRQLRKELTQAQTEKMEATAQMSECLRKCNRKDELLQQIKPQFIYVYQELLIPFINCGIDEKLVPTKRKADINELYDSMVVIDKPGQSPNNSSSFHSQDFQQFASLNRRLTEYFADLALCLKNLSIVEQSIDAPI
ncbi:hypothetical protein OGAPHI_006804 [Ogataea philodendri]|uniref:Uncharacterized protein n=1 Tax=Ogataea philodendri TaxID=1378263 RepID=A0A9P8NXJ3_9ASCO|nr:uncharacterized protein OGAPHI_006804 [Ogataea philodendri]KAH3661397.1 hypothetical protein OGAPHI_006804 [Ogataea philodendri]